MTPTLSPEHLPHLIAGLLFVGLCFVVMVADMGQEDEDDG